MKTFSVIAGIALAILLGIGLYFVFFKSSSTTPSTTSSTTPSNPFGGSTTTNSPPNSSTGASSLLTVTLKNGSTVVTPNFTEQNQPPNSNATSGYQVAGSNTGDFQILYYPSQSYFIVSLFSEPLGATRLEAETALQKTLGLSQAQLCQLNIQIETPNDVSDLYSGRDLGLSFCPGAVQLPQ